MLPLDTPAPLAETADSITEVTVSLVTIEQLLRDGTALFEQHRCELYDHMGITNIKLDLESFRFLEAKNLLVLLAAYWGPELVGYAVNILLPSQFSRTMTLCKNETVFVAPPWRLTRVPMMLLRETERFAKAGGAVRMVWAVPTTSPLAGWLPRLGYKTEELVFFKEV